MPNVIIISSCIAGIYCASDSGPHFGMALTSLGDLIIANNAHLGALSSSMFPRAYLNPAVSKVAATPGLFGANRFVVDDYEVFQLCES